MEPRTALVAGATGLVGSHLVRRLLGGGRYGRVTTLGRRPLDLAHPKLDDRVVDFDRLPDAPDLPASDDAFCCLGTTIKKAGSEAAFRKVDLDYVVAFAEAALALGARQLLVVSAMGADRASRIFYNRVKGEMETAVAKLPFEAVQIFRPSLLLGERDEDRLGEEVATLLMRPLAPLMVGPARKYRPVEAEAVAAAMERVAVERRTGVHVYESDQIQALGKGW